MLIDIINQLKAGKKLLIFYPYCKGNDKNQSMLSLSELLTKQTGKKGICHNSMTSDVVKNKFKMLMRNGQRLILLYLIM